MSRADGSILVLNPGWKMTMARVEFQRFVEVACDDDSKVCEWVARIRTSVNRPRRRNGQEPVSPSRLNANPTSGRGTFKQHRLGQIDCNVSGFIATTEEQPLYASLL